VQGWKDGTWCCILNLGIRAVKLLIRWRFNELMARVRMKNKEMGERIGKHQETISRWRRTDKMPKVDGDELSAICKALGCTLEELIQDVPEAENEKEAGNCE
jgi:putative transcriptional regulator